MSKTKSRWGNPVWDETDLDIRQLLMREDVPEGLRDALLREQIEKLHAIKDAQDPQWRERQTIVADPYEVPRVHAGGVDGMWRFGNYE